LVIGKMASLDQLKGNARDATSPTYPAAMSRPARESGGHDHHHHHYGHGD
jgi:hypothetical protein